MTPKQTTEINLFISFNVSNTLKDEEADYYGNNMAKKLKYKNLNFKEKLLNCFWD
jgi:hypothetical protein